METITEYVTLNPDTLEEDANGVPYTRKRIGRAVILIAGGHPATDAEQIEEDKE